MTKLLIPLLLLASLLSAAPAPSPGPAVLECPIGVTCRTWVDGGATYLEAVNGTKRSVSGTVTLNEIYEKAIVVKGAGSAEIDGRWIELELGPEVKLLVRLGK